MTFAELTRLLDSKRRVQKEDAKQRAYFDYKLADMMAMSMGRLYNSENQFPEIYEIYPDLFNNQEVKELQVKRQDELSALRFKQFANAHNKKFEGGKL